MTTTSFMARSAAAAGAQSGDPEASGKVGKDESIPVSVRFSEAQLQCVDSEADQEGLDRSNFIRMATLAETRWDPQGVGKMKVADRLAEMSARIESLERTILNLTSLVLARQEKS